MASFSSVRTVSRTGRPVKRMLKRWLIHDSVDQASSAEPHFESHELVRSEIGKAPRAGHAVETRLASLISFLVERDALGFIQTATIPCSNLRVALSKSEPVWTYILSCSQPSLPPENQRGISQRHPGRSDRPRV